MQANRQERKENRRENVAERRENRQDRRADRREDRRDDDGGSYTSGGGGGGGKTRPGMTDVVRNISSKNLGSRPGGGFAGKTDYESLGQYSNFDKFSTYQRPLPGAGAEGGGGGGGGNVAGASLSGLQGSSVDEILKGSKKGRRQRRRRGTE